MHTMNANKRQKISSSSSLRILQPVNNQVLSKLATVKKRPLSPEPLNEKERILFFDNKLSERVYLRAKQILQEIFEKVALKMNDIKYKVTASYTIVKMNGIFKTWCCTYDLKWPENIQFKQTAPTKQQAAQGAAVKTLTWLREHGNITENGEPIFHVDEKVEVLELYGSAKHVLHNALHSVSQKLNNVELQVKPSYAQLPNSFGWSCTYSLKWPELRNITEVGFTKKDAGEEAALSALLWLRNEKKINETGQPIFSETNVANEIQHNKKIIQTANPFLSQTVASNSITTEIRHNKKIIHITYPPLPQSALPKSIAKEIQQAKKIAETAFHYLPQNVPKSIAKEIQQAKKIAQTAFSYLPQSVSNNIAKGIQQAEKIAQTTYPFLSQSVVPNSIAKETQQTQASQRLKLHLSALDNFKKLVQECQEQNNANKEPEIKPNKLILHSSVLTNIRKIIQEYQENFLTKTIKKEDIPKEEKATPAIDAEKITFKRTTKQQLLDDDKYLAKEKTELPVSQHKQEIIHTVMNNRVVIIKGEAGCGKSSRIPQYVLEAWIKNTKNKQRPFRIAVTQPRRIAAISLAERVALERDEQCGLVVGYQIRLNKKFEETTGRILYCTSGILLRHLETDLSLPNFSCVVLDEVHERETNTDLLMCLLKKSLALNPKLKLLVMSATIDTELFKNYFDGAPVLHISGFVHPVEEHFLDDLTAVDLQKSKKMCTAPLPSVIHDDVVKVIVHIHTTKGEGAVLCFLPGWDDICAVKRLLPSSDDLTVFCLHSRVQDSEQWKVFEPAEGGKRKVILATNIAETSVTINDVVFVIDTGVRKESRYDFEQGLVCLDGEWISKASVIQRKGRAGRVRPGESFHLFTREKFASMAEFSDPEIMKISLSKIVLSVKAFYGGSVDEFMNKLPTPPQEKAVEKAVLELQELQLLDDKENLMPLGRILANFQLDPVLAKTLVNAAIFECVTPINDIVTILSSEIDMFSNVFGCKNLMRQVKEKTNFKTTDHLALMMLFESWLEELEEGSENRAIAFCEKTKLHHYNLITLLDLRNINLIYVHNSLTNTFQISDKYSDNYELVKAVLFFGFGKFVQCKKSRKKYSFTTNNNHQAVISLESVNFKPEEINTEFLIYMSEMKTKAKKNSIIRECSTVPILSILLFSRQDLTVTKINDEEAMLGLIGTSINYLCSNRDATDIQLCKKAINAVYEYNITMLSDSNNFDPEIKKIWDVMLTCINEIFLKL